MLQLKKSLNLAQSEVKFNADTGAFAGYASVWDGVDSYLDTIVKGAFSETLATNGLPKMFFQHDTSMPIGKYTNADETQKGLWVEGELTPGHSLATDVRAALKHQTLDGLSISGYIVKDGYTIQKNGGRLITKWTNLTEVSPVVFPADRAARIDAGSVKSVDFEALLPECKSERDIERLLRDAGLSKWDAMAFVSRAKAIFSGRDACKDGDDKAMAEIARRLQKLEKISA